jgi:hypothetical protein
MSRIKILGKVLNNQDIAALKALATEAGCEAKELEVIDSIGEPDPVCEDEVVLVLATSDTCSSPDLEEELAKTPNGGRRVICIWPKSTHGDALPEATKKYSYSIIPWSSQKLSVVLADDDVTFFERADGTALPKVKTDRNLCVDEKPK